MSSTELGTLALLALVDSTSVGTLLLPIWFLLTPGGVSIRRFLVFLATIAGFYFTVGMVLLIGGNAWLGGLRDWATTTTGARILLVVGVLLFALSFRIGDGRADGTPGRIRTWRDRAVGSPEGDASGGLGSLMGLALLAGTVELAGMLPYLAGIGIISSAEQPLSLQVGALASYCLIMVLPACLLLVVRLGARSLIEPALARLAAWMERHAGETTAWIVGILGFLIAGNSWEAAAVPQLWSAVSR